MLLEHALTGLGCSISGFTGISAFEFYIICVSDPGGLGFGDRMKARKGRALPFLQTRFVERLAFKDAGVRVIKDLMQRFSYSRLCRTVQGFLQVLSSAVY